MSVKNQSLQSLLDQALELLRQYKVTKDQRIKAELSKYLTKCPECEFKAFLVNRVIECPECGCEIEDSFKVKSDRELIKEMIGIDLDEIDNFDEDSIGLTDQITIDLK